MVFEGIATSDFLFQMILPFIFLFALLFGLLSEIKWFDKRINMIIAISSSLMVFASGVPTLVIQYSSSLPYVALGAFVVIFIFGAIRYTMGTGIQLHRKATDPTSKLKRLYKDREKLV